MFEQSLITAEKGRQKWTVPLAILGKLMIVGILVLVPLVYVQILPAPELISRLTLPPLPPPPPPPPPPPLAAHPRAPKTVARKFDPSKLTAPATIPPKVTILSESGPALSEPPAIGGVPGGVPGGAVGGTLGGILGSVTATATAPPPPQTPVAPPQPATPSRIRVGGEVEAGLLIHEVKPVYPPLARGARVAGTVMLKAVIGRDGKVEKLNVVSGNQLLVSSALEAVKQWVYKLTFLKGQAVEVDTEIVVHFTLT
jgi:protein TonB